MEQNTSNSSVKLTFEGDFDINPDHQLLSTLIKCWSEDMKKSVQDHIDSSYTLHSTRHFHTRFEELFREHKQDFEVSHEEFMMFNVGQMDVSCNDVLSLRAVELKCSNNCVTNTTPYWILQARGKLALTMKTSTQVGYYIGLWGLPFNSQTRKIDLNQDSKKDSVTVLALYCHGPNFGNFFDLSKPWLNN